MPNTTKQISSATVGASVQVVLDGEILFSGVQAYITADGWVGIRTEGERIDEARLELVVIDPS